MKITFPSSGSWPSWLSPALLLLLGSLNILFGAIQLDAIQQGPPEHPDEFTSMQYHETAVPIVLHIVFGILFNLLGPFQFVPRIRHRWPGWHRNSGRLWIISGFVVAFTGMWMNHYFPAYGGVAKYTGILTHCVGMIIALSFAFYAILNRQINQHRIGMMVAMAIGLAPATQRVIILPWYYLTGEINDLLIGMVIWLGLLINLAVTLLIIRKKKYHLNLSSTHNKLTKAL